MFQDFENYEQKMLALSNECDSCYNSIFKMWQLATYKYRNEKDEVNHKVALAKYKQAFEKYLAKDTFDFTDRKLTTYLREGHYHYTYGEYDKAIHSYAQIINGVNNGSPYNYDIHVTKNIAYQRMAGIEYKRSNKAKARRIYQYAIDDELEMATEEDRDPVVYSIYAKLAEIDLSQNKLESAYQNYEKCNLVLRQKMLQRTTKQLRRLVYQYTDRFLGQAKVAIHLEKWQKAQELFSWIDQMPLIANSPNNLKIDLAKLQLAYARNDLKAIKKYTTILNKQLATFDNTYETEAEFSLLKIRNYQQSDVNPELELDALLDLCNQHLDELESIRIEAWILKTQRLSEQSRISDIIELVHEVKTHLSERVSNDILFEDHIQSIEKYYTVYEQFLSILYEQDNVEYELIFELIEDLKSLDLLKTYRRITARDLSSDSTYIEYKSLSNQLLQIQRKANKDSENISLRNKVFKLEELVDFLKDKIDENVFKKNIGSINSAELVKLLPDNGTYISFFAGKDYYYGYSINTNGKTHIKRIDKALVDSDILKLEAEITAPTKLSTFTKISESLYSLLADLFEYPDNNNLVISLDGLLNKIPFESLVDWKGDFLVHSHDIGYTPSARMYKEVNTPSIKEQSVGVILPSIEKTSTLYLPFAKDEASNIKKISDGLLYEGNQAVKENIANLAKQHSILHIASHSVMDISDESNQFIRMSPSNIDGKSALYFDEINQLILPLEMVCLSACQTGYGKQAISEGTLSMGRSFMASGCKSVVSTLWSVSDQTSSFIMQAFYENLFEGFPKHKALADAKRQYLLTYDDVELKHPHYWAGYTLYGNPQSIVNKKSFPWKIAGTLFLVGLVLFYFYKKQRAT